jgi:hypothetical protein
MSTYYLTAKRHSSTRVHLITAHDDASAMMEAIPYIMDKAHKQRKGPWALGNIKLKDDHGNLVADMDAKS